MEGVICDRATAVGRSARIGAASVQALREGPGNRLSAIIGVAGKHGPGHKG